MSTGLSNAGTPGADPVDFVLLWVDGADPAWQAEFLRWKASGSDGAAAREAQNDNGVWRYRDMGLLRYWFRAVDRFAPWVRHVHFVTCGHRPEWLDPACPKLRLVPHTGFMPAEWLPTFNPRALQLNLHRIPDLAERFVLFDDDTFLLRPVGPELYFRGGNPVLTASLRLPRYLSDLNWVRTVHNDTYEVNAHLDIPRLLRANLRKWCDFRALGPVRALSNLACVFLNGWLPEKSFGHLPLPHLKSTLAEIWRHCPETLERTSRQKFRSHDQVSHWLMATWNLAIGRFHPTVLPPLDAMVEIRRSTINAACAAVRAQKYPQVCFNDSAGTDDPDCCFGLLRQALDELLPEKSSFEK